MRIKIDYISKMGGQTGFTAKIVAGKIKEAKLMVREGARLIEGTLVGRKFYEVPMLTSRICGICPTVHILCAIKALENAAKIKISEQTKLLRKLMLLGQIINSHALHAFFWSLSDFFGFKSDLELMKKYPGLTKDVLRIRDWSNELTRVIGGRAIHPISPRLGGFKKLPQKSELQNLLNSQPRVLESTLKVADFFVKLHFPQFERKLEFISLYHPKEYPFYEGCIKVGERLCLEEQFLKDIKEIQRPYQIVKRSFYKGEPFRVGALARLYLNQSKLNPQAKKILTVSKISYFNPFYNTLAQIVEIVHGLEEASKIIKFLIRRRLKEEKLPQCDKLKLTSGIGVVEAPRGTLYHAFKVDSRGYIKKVNIIAPTAQNFASLEEDLKVYLRSEDSLAEKKRKIKTLIRAYDPCIPCATH